jgi:hypothetical protein
LNSMLENCIFSVNTKASGNISNLRDIISTQKVLAGYLHNILFYEQLPKDIHQHHVACYRSKLTPILTLMYLTTFGIKMPFKVDTN